MVRFQPEVDQYEEMENDAKPKVDHVLVKEIRDLKEAMRNLQITKESKSLEYEDLCVQHNIDLPVGYKPPKFDLFNRFSDLHAHLRDYYDKLVGVGRNKMIRMKLFIRSLSGEALAWFNTEITPVRFYLAKLKKKSTETFSQYALHWRVEAARVQPPMSESEMISTFIECQDNSLYYDKMITMMGQKLMKVVGIREILEDGIKSGRIQDYTSLQAASKAIQYGFINENKKKKEDVSSP
ncbi:uncharacterized protein LOC124889738 [Capsicum annuum]|uniref:uncharacterized protein LOC124889738 n=1 Tax=Capsicum annuum TaxID=4072 RepID=UPI001FB08161|nr:uncharacterized protein LOC124889738 [Capsicum annuum]